ncbi:MAG: zinc-ribbon domain-containing protein [Pyrinomonadaceae bacterium]
MEKRCHKCGSPVGAEQAFCPTCGAVIGMSEAAPRADGGWDLASTVVGQQQPATPPRASAERRAHQTRPEAAPQQPAPRKSNAMLLALIGFVAVLLIGGLIILLLYLNQQR